VLPLLTATTTSHSHHNSRDKNILESCRSGDFKLSLFLLVPQMLQFCLELKKKNSFVQLGTPSNIWKYKSTPGITPFITFYNSGCQAKNSKTVFSPLPLSCQQGVDITA